MELNINYKNLSRVVRSGHFRKTPNQKIGSIIENKGPNRMDL